MYQIWTVRKQAVLEMLSFSTDSGHTLDVFLVTGQ